VNILAFFAHPDDETMLCGGTLALLSKSGANVHYLCATRGEGGDVGEPALCEREELGKVREQELRCAVQALSGPDACLEFLDYIDPTVGPEDTLYPYEAETEVIITQVLEAIRRSQADVLLTHGSNGEYGHPAHKRTHEVAVLAVERLGGNAPLLYTVQAHYEDNPKPHLANEDDSAHLVLDISTVLDRKIAAAVCHTTQHDLFVRRASKEAGRRMTIPEVIVATESLHRLRPAADGLPIDELARLLIYSGAVVQQA
jgi:LmbE family N-acetylglucosaminyl deacetylase